MQDLKKAVQYAQKFVNSSLLNYALSVALIHRDDAIDVNLQIPSHVFTDPGMYFDMSKVTDDLGNKNVTETTPADKNGIKKVILVIFYLKFLEWVSITSRFT